MSDQPTLEQLVEHAEGLNASLRYLLQKEEEFLEHLRKLPQLSIPTPEEPREPPNYDDPPMGLRYDD